MTEQGFETLKVWQKAHAFMLDIHRRLVPLLPARKDALKSRASFLSAAGSNPALPARRMRPRKGAFFASEAAPIPPKDGRDEVAVRCSENPRTGAVVFGCDGEGERGIYYNLASKLFASCYNYPHKFIRQGIH
jgi:hypothetical protein